MWCVITGYGGVSYDCFTDLYDILNGDLTGFHYRDEINKAFVTLMLVLWTRTVLMDGNALPCRACFANDYTELERNMMYGPS